MIQAPVHHIALLVPSVQKAARVLEKQGFPIGPTEEWDGEGTREIYVGPDTHEARLLLMEPTKPGAYERAMKKRGPGLHHIAIDVLDVETWISSLSGSGWLLHPKSLSTLKKTKTAWLAKPGLKTLIEVQERETLETSERFITRLEMPLSDGEQAMMRALGIGDWISSAETGLRFWMGKIPIPWDTLI